MCELHGLLCGIATAINCRRYIENVVLTCSTNMNVLYCFSADSVDFKSFNQSGRRCFGVRLYTYIDCPFLSINISSGFHSASVLGSLNTGLLGSDINIFKTGKYILNKGMNTPKFRELVKS